MKIKNHQEPSRSKHVQEQKHVADNRDGRKDKLADGKTAKGDGSANLAKVAPTRK